MDPRIRATRPEIWFNNVTSICPECGRDLNGKHHLTSAGHVIMRQFCPEHGHRAVLVSTDFEWFTKYEQMAAVLPPRADRAVPEGLCCKPELALEADATSERIRKLMWLKDASPGAVHFTARVATRVAEAMGQAAQARIPCVSIALTAAQLLERETAAAIEAAGALAHVDAEDPQLAELLERRASMKLVLVSRLDRPDVSEPLARAFRRFSESPGICSWEIVPQGKVAAEWYKHDHHPSKGPGGLPSNGPVPAPGPIAATLSEALPLVVQASDGVLDRDAFFPLQRFHPPGSAMAVVRRGATLTALNAALEPRKAIDLVVGAHPADSKDPAVLAVRALFGATGRMHPTMVNALVSQGLREGGLVAEDHRAESAGPASRAQVAVVIVHHPLTRLMFDRNRHLRACPVPRENRDECNEACTHRAP